MADITIITNHIPRDVIEAWELSEEDRKEFDYLPWDKIERGEDSATFVRYRGELIDLGDMERQHQGMPRGLERWHNYRSDSFFSGILIKWVDDYERVIVGTYYVS